MHNDKKKLFITGGTGLLGINWAYSNFKKYKIIIGFNKRQPILQNIYGQKVNFSNLDNTKKTLNNIKPDVVVNTIGLTNIEECEKFPRNSEFANEIIPLYLAKACNDIKIPFVHISTDHLFDGTKALVSENEIVKPLNQYGKSKGRGEDLVRENHSKAIIVRTNFFGWGTSFRQSFSDFIISNLRMERKVTLFKDVFFTPILIEKLIDNVYELLDRNLSGTFNIVSDDRLSKYEFGIKIAKKFDLNLDLIQSGNIYDNKNLILRPRDMSLSNKKLSLILNRSVGTTNQYIETLFQQEKLKQILKF